MSPTDLLTNSVTMLPLELSWTQWAAKKSKNAVRKRGNYKRVSPLCIVQLAPRFFPQSSVDRAKTSNSTRMTALPDSSHPEFLPQSLERATFCRGQSQPHFAKGLNIPIFQTNNP